MKLFTCQQLSSEWWELHRGRPTASSFDKILTPKTLKPSASQTDLICELIAQKFMHEPMGAGDGYTSPAMMQGTINEPEARRWYCMESDLEVQQVGFCMTDCERFGASPDGLVGEDGGLEIKCPTLKVQARYLIDGVLPAEYRGQVHGCLIVTRRAWWDFVSYSPGLKPFRIRTEPDDYTKALKEELERFWEKYLAAVEKVQI